MKWAFTTQPNYRIHLSLSLLSIIGGCVLNISMYEFLLIIVLITLGLTIETINTALEKAGDAIDEAWREDIRVVKDVAAGSMLIFAIGSSIIAGIIFVPRIIQLIGI